MNTIERNRLAKRLRVDHDETLVLQSAHMNILAAAARGEIDLNLWAREELAARGVDKYGVWVGFAAAARLHGVSP